MQSKACVRGMVCLSAGGGVYSEQYNIFDTACAKREVE